MRRRAPAAVRPWTARGCGEHVLGIPDTRKLRAARGVSPAMGTPPSRRARSETEGRRSARSPAGDARPDRRATGAALQRRRSESNRRSRICSPLPYHLATAPKEWGADERAPHTGFARAGNRTRTGDPHLGKVVLYQLSYSRMKGGPGRAIHPPRPTFRARISSQGDSNVRRAVAGCQPPPAPPPGRFTPATVTVNLSPLPSPFRMCRAR